MLVLDFSTQLTDFQTGHPARVARRVIQRQDQPIILTGFQALNKLLGRPIYTSQLQLGGPAVMAANGVSHNVVADDLQGVAAVLQWLSYVPTHAGSQVPQPPQRGPAAQAHAANGHAAPQPEPAVFPEGLLGVQPPLDPADRPISYTPEAGDKFDVRQAITGTAAALGQHSATGSAADRGRGPASRRTSADSVRRNSTTGVAHARMRSADSGAGAGAGVSAVTGGLFDEGSWVERHASWARTVVTGHARLAGTPVGVLGVEADGVMLTLPADPGLPESVEQHVPQAGQVRARAQAACS